VDEEGETLEAEEGNTTTNPPLASRVTPQTWGIPQMHASNVAKWDIMLENAHKGNNAQGTTGRTKQPTLSISKIHIQALMTLTLRVLPMKKAVKKPSNRYRPD